MLWTVLFAVPFSHVDRRGRIACLAAPPGPLVWAVSDQQLTALGVRISVRVQYPAPAAHQNATDDHHRNKQATTRSFLLHGRVVGRDFVDAVTPALTTGSIFVTHVLRQMYLGFMPIGAVRVVTLGADFHRFTVIVALLAKRWTHGNLHYLRLVTTFLDPVLSLPIDTGGAAV